MKVMLGKQIPLWRGCFKGPPVALFELMKTLVVLLLANRKIPAHDHEQPQWLEADMAHGEIQNSAAPVLRVWHHEDVEEKLLNMRA